MFNEIDKEIAYPSVQIVRLGGEPVIQTDIINLSNKFNDKCLFDKWICLNRITKTIVIILLIIHLNCEVGFPRLVYPAKETLYKKCNEQCVWVK